MDLALNNLQLFAWLVGAVEYTASLLSGKTSPKKCLEFDTKQSDGEVLVMLKL